MSITRFLFNALRSAATKETPLSPQMLIGRLGDVVNESSPAYELIEEFWQHHKHFRESAQSFSIRHPKDSYFPLEIIHKQPLRDFFIGHYSALLKKHRLLCAASESSVWFYSGPEPVDFPTDRDGFRVVVNSPPNTVQIGVANVSHFHRPHVDEGEETDTSSNQDQAQRLSPFDDLQLISKALEETPMIKPPQFGGQVGFSAPSIFPGNPTAPEPTTGTPLGDATPENEVINEMVYPLGCRVPFCISSDRVKYIVGVYMDCGSVTIQFEDATTISLSASDEKYTFSKAVSALNRAKKKYK